MEGNTYRYDLYMITALSNMHVGSGDINFGVVDNLVQKDLITSVPTINSSSLKGAFREFFNTDGTISDTEIDYIFGPPQKARKDGKKKSGSGMYKFFTANLLTLPARSSKKPFFRATAPMLLKEFLNSVELFKLNIAQKEIIKELIKNAAPEKGKPVISENLGADIEDFQAVYKLLDKIDDLKFVMGCDVAIFHDDDFKELCENLPVIARNHLENGKSQNLWYEEVVPRQSRFYFILAVPDSDDTKDINKKFSELLQKNLIQIGANASIGYGFTEIKRIDRQERQ